jgi:hypothetical protein
MAGGEIKMGKKESLGTVIMDKRTLIAMIIIAILWRAGISFDGKIALWESMCSGIALFVVGWALVAYIYLLSRELKAVAIDFEESVAAFAAVYLKSRGLEGWLELSKIYQWIAISLAAINIHVLIYFAMRWYRLAGIGGIEEALVPFDFLWRDVRYITLVAFYCTVIWLAKCLKKVHADYLLLFKK